MSIVYAVVLGLVAGTHAATWGAFKDAPFEGFKAASFIRSIALATAVAVVLSTTTELHTTLAPVVLLGVLYASERLATEWWKSFFREDDQDAYAIPMRVAVAGRPVDARLPRYLTALVVLTGLVLTGWAAAALQPADDGPLWLLVLVGGVGGWLTAVGGAWKDAPVEGFSGWKFLRSPVVATVWTIMLLPFTHDWVAMAVAAAGLSVLSIETYKTFLTGGRPPGKFDGKPVRPVPGARRERCRHLHAGVYVGLACAAGLAVLVDAGDQTTSSILSLMVLAVAAATLVVLVALSPTGTTEPGVRRKVGADAVPQ